MRKQLIILLAFFIPFVAFSQSPSTMDAGAEDEAVKTGLKVMVIPFHPIKYYFSDCDKKLARRTKMKESEVREGFMFGMDYAMEDKLEKKYEALNLLQMKDSVSKETLDELYDNTNFVYDDPTRGASRKQLKFIKKWKKEIKKKKQRSAKVADQDAYFEFENMDGQYMKCVWQNQAFLEKMTAEYQPDYYITINQFEIKTDYEKCIDRELGIYRRRVKVHFNVFTPQGELIYGDVVTAKYDAKTDDVNKIIQDNFGFLAEYITKSIP